MKKQFIKSIFILFVALISTEIYAQVPQGFNFQAVARGSDGLPLIEQGLGVQVTILDASGSAVYTEAHTDTTNAAGLLQLVIGEGTPASGNSFTNINWASGNYFVKLAIDPAGGTSYEELGTTRLLSVPYALVAHDVVNGATGEGLTQFTFNKDSGDTSFVVNSVGSQGLPAITGKAATGGANSGGSFYAVSGAENQDYQYGVYGDATGAGSGSHVGTFGYARSSNGSATGAYGGVDVSDNPNSYFDIGVSGQVYGTLTEPTTFSVGAYGQNTVTGGSEAWGTGGFAGGDGINRAFRGRANSLDGNTAEQFGAWLQANGGGTGNHYGVWANAAGQGVNKGIYATASGGTENYAGFFDGDVQINGNLNVTGAINGALGAGDDDYTDFIEINTADSTLQDSLTIIVVGNELESETAHGVNVIGFSTGRNRPLLGQIREDASNGASQYAVNGRADGPGSGTHIGVLGSAYNTAATGGTRYGLYGQSNSLAKYNIGAFGYASGTGSGEYIPLGDPAESEGNFGSFNQGLAAYATGNSNGNIGIDSEVWGTEGQRINIGAEFRVLTTASGQNSGVQAIVNGSTSLNRGFWGLVNGDNNNVGMDLTVEGGTSNKGIVVTSDIAAELNGTVNVNGDLNYTGSLTNTSDRNLKENIQPLENGLETIMKLNPTTYNFRGNGRYKGLSLSTGLHYGLIAQEVEEVLPALVKDNVHTYTEESAAGQGPNTGSGDDVVKTMEYKTMNYTELIPVLIKAVQEQQAEIERLTKELEALKKGQN